jgi:EmrB/QacA subfamily drug resistance transporter
MTSLDASIVNIGLPAIAHDFGTPLSGTIEWVVIGYLVVIAALQLTCGRLSDMLGRPPIWLAGLVVFTLGSALCGAAPSLELLIAARAFQGIGGALIFATSVAILTDAFPATERGRALSANAVAVALGTSAGPTLGGLLTEYLSWRWIFYVNVPIALGAVLATLIVLPPTVRRGPGRFDPLGALLLGVGVTAVTIGLSFGQEWGWTSPRLVLVLALSAAALLAAALVERVVPDPIVDLALLRDRVFASALGSLVLMMMALFAVSFLMPFYFEELRGLSTAEAGLLLTPLPLTIAVVAPLAGALADRFGSRWLSPLGLAITALGLILLARLDATSPIADVAWRLVVVGIGQGLFQSPNTKALMDAAPPTEQGEASGLLATARVIGQSLSVAVAGAVFAGLGAATAGAALAGQRVGLTTDQIIALQETFVHGFQAALLVCASFAAVGVLAALVRGREREQSAPGAR